jgi:hypothetical protein
VWQLAPEWRNFFPPSRPPERHHVLLTYLAINVDSYLCIVADPQTSKKDRLSTGPYGLPRRKEIVVPLATAKMMVRWCTKAKSQPKHSLGKVILSLIFFQPSCIMLRRRLERVACFNANICSNFWTAKTCPESTLTLKKVSRIPSFIFIIELRAIDSFEAK